MGAYKPKTNSKKMGRRKGYREKKRGRSYTLRIEAVNRIYEKYRSQGLSNREIWYRYIYPVYGICERTFYNLLKASIRQGDALGASGHPSLFGEQDEK